MKKIICLIFSVVALLAFTACERRGSYDIEVVGESIVYMGDFSFEDYEVKVKNKKTGNLVKIVPLSSKMLSAETRMNVYNEGTSNIHVTYQGAETDFEITIKRKEFSKTEIGFFTKQYVYTGRPITINLEGNLPAGTQLYYSSGNVFTKVGKYDIICKISHPFYKTLEICESVEIVEGDL